MSSGKTVLVTGARGFVGAPTVEAFLAGGWSVVSALRAARAARADGGRRAEDGLAEGGDLVRDDGGYLKPDGGAEGGGRNYREVVVGDLGPDTDWAEALRGVDVVVHLAARVHQMQDKAADPLTEFRRVNVEGTRRLAEQAAAAGARRFVFVSSIKVNGEGTGPGASFNAGDPPAPEDPYGRSKAEAEVALREVGAATGLQIVIVRPPLMVGRGVKGNLAKLAGAIRRGRPLPFGCIRENRRSLLDVRNLAELIERCAWHPGAPGQVFLASDGVPVSTAELARQVGRAVGRAPRLVPVPVACLRLAGRLSGRSAAVARLTGSLLIDDSATRCLLEWSPRFGPGDWEL